MGKNKGKGTDAVSEIREGAKRAGVPLAAIEGGLAHVTFHVNGKPHVLDLTKVERKVRAGKGINQNPQAEMVEGFVACGIPKANAEKIAANAVALAVSYAEVTPPGNEPEGGSYADIGELIRSL